MSDCPDCTEISPPINGVSVVEACQPCSDRMVRAHDEWLARHIAEAHTA